MPAENQTGQDKGFRTSLLGFDKNDVLAYVNTLANEAQQLELTYQNRLRELQTRNSELEKESAYAKACTDKLRAQLEEAYSRADIAEKQSADAASQKALADAQTLGLRKQCEESEQAAQQLRTQNAELQKQVEALLAAQRTAQPAAPQAVQAAPTAPAQQAEPAAQPRHAKSADLYDRARVEARRILEDARLTAESAQRRMDEEAAQRKRRMAENARGIAAGVMILRDRIARVDDTLSSVSMELDNATGALYKALEDTTADLAELDAGFQAFVNGTPETTEPPARQPASEPKPAQARPIYRPKRAAVKPVRLRSAGAGRRAVAQSLNDAVSRLDRQDKEKE